MVATEYLEQLFEKHKANQLVWAGNCFSCNKKVEIKAILTYDKIEIENGAIYLDPDNEFYIQCKACSITKPPDNAKAKCHLRMVKQLDLFKNA